MKILKFREDSGVLTIRLDTLEDLWSAARIVFPGDRVRSKSLRKFKASETDKGEMKEVTVTISVEKTELDKNAQRLRFMGKILDGHPMEYVRMGGYHTINAALGDIIDVWKARWPAYMVNVVRNAVSDSRKAKLGIVVMDDEKAQPACLLGYGIDFKNEIYSHLSKRMSQRDFQAQQDKYFSSITKSMETMDVSTIIIAGPGFKKDEFKRHLDDSGQSSKLGKKLVYMNVSNAERSGVYELIRSDEVSGILQHEHIRKEFLLMEEFLKGLSGQASKYGTENVGKAVDNYEASTVIVNDAALIDPEIQKLLSRAERKGIRVEVFSSEDEVGQQLHSFKDVACIS